MSTFVLANEFTVLFNNDFFNTLQTFLFYIHSETEGEVERLTQEVTIVIHTHTKKILQKFVRNFMTGFSTAILLFHIII